MPRQMSQDTPKETVKAKTAPASRHPYADGTYKKMLIDGKWVDARSGQTFAIEDPATEEIIATFHSNGVPAAMAKFMANAGFDVKPEGAPVVSEPSPDQIAHGTRFLAHELRGTARYVPDIAALPRGPAEVVVGIGAASGGLLTYRTSVALADQLGTSPVEFPGDHGGFIGQPAEFAQTLRAVLAG